MLLAVKPQHMESALESIKAAVDQNALVLSIAAGCPLEMINEKLPKTNSIVRAMPNTPAMYV